MASLRTNGWAAVMLLLALGGLLGCGSTGNDPGGCQAASDCAGDPGTGCIWACIDGTCETLCTEECAVAADCGSLSWPLDCEGHWECRDHACEAICDGQGCQTVNDCDGLPWELQCPGHWECQAGDCVAVCDQEGCAEASDCWPLSLPCQYGGEWECQAGDCVPNCADQCQTVADCQDLGLPCPGGGHWQCDGGACVAECDPPPDCSQAQDCLDLPWMVDCHGHWACEQRVCVEVCDFDACPNGICDDTGGESAQSCPQDCDLDCLVPADCEHLFWPIRCEGHWECDADGLCQAVCDGGECGRDSDCLGFPWLPGCLGDWDCQEGSCQPNCNAQSCGDGDCDPDIGEGPDTCPLDCFQGQCIPEGLPQVGPLGCCPGLQPVEDCLPGHACPGALLYCVDCRDAVCEPHENQFNCPGDCPFGCELG